jgi:tripartite-type tricarboxylate transporter receptor subunit TctC
MQTNRLFRSAFLRGGFLLVGALLAVPAFAQYPDKALRLIVPWPAGGPTDTIGRIMAQKLSEGFGKSVVVENKVGAVGLLGTTEVARAPADGYTLGMVVVQDVTRPAFLPSVPIDVMKDLTPIIKVYDLPFLITVNPQVFPVATLKEIIDYAKKNPGKLQYASTSNGSVGHMSFELIKTLAGFEAVHIAYKGSAPAINDLLGGHIPMMFGDMVSALPHVRSGKIRAIAIGTAKRVAVLPNVPTIAESGFPGFLGVAWGGLAVPAATPAAVRERLHQEAARILASDDTQQRIRALGVEPAPADSAEAFRGFMQAEMEKWGKLIRDRKIEAQ